MGLFLAVSAFRHCNSKEVAQACRDFFLSHAVTVEAHPLNDPVDHLTDVVIFAPAGGWLVVLWPEYFGVNVGAAARDMAVTHDWLVSTVKVYDGDYWEHLAYRGHEELHSYCSWPNYWDEEDPGADWKNDPAALASALGVPSDSLRPYLIDAGKFRDETSPRKAQPEDEYDLSNIWVFIDFWKRLGIAYPEPGKDIAQILRITTEGFMDKLPV